MKWPHVEQTVILNEVCKLPQITEAGGHGARRPRYLCTCRTFGWSVGLDSRLVNLRSASTSLPVMRFVSIRSSSAEMRALVPYCRRRLYCLAASVRSFV